jgi:diacylglycerol kinase family enzyme
VVAGSRCFALEMDGEVVQARKADFKVVPKAVRCCA